MYSPVQTLMSWKLQGFRCPDGGIVRIYDTAPAHHTVLNAPEREKTINGDGQKEIRVRWNILPDPPLSRYPTVLWAIQPLTTGRGGTQVLIRWKLTSRPRIPPCTNFP